MVAVPLSLRREGGGDPSLMGFFPESQALRGPVPLPDDALETGCLQPTAPAHIPPRPYGPAPRSQLK